MSDATGSAAPRRRRRGRNRPQAETAQAFAQRPFTQPRRLYRPVDMISADELESIHEASLRVLQEIGLDVLHVEARELMRAAGADVRPGEERVRLDGDMIMERMASAPESFTLHARNPAHDLQIGGDAMAFCMVASAPNCADREGGRRTGNQKDFRDLVRLAQMHNIIHLTGGYPVEPVDIHASVRHLDCIADFLILTDKPFHAYSLGLERNRDALELARIGRGVDPDRFREEPSVFSVINTNSPLKLDGPMMQGIIEMASQGQPVVVTPFTLAGAMAPVTVAGALVQQNAEALAGMAFAQIVRPGAPVVYGGFTSNVDMRSGAPAFGTPEYVQAQHVGGQLARRYNVPYRTSNVCAANTVDAQAAYESVFSLWGAVNSGGNMLKHGAGWLEGGLTCSYEKVILDVDLLQMVAEMMRPLDVSEPALALEAMQDVGPGGHFFGTAHTQARYREAFYEPVLSDWRNFETWQEAGGPTAYEKASRTWKERLAAYEQPAMDPAIREAIDDFVARRKREGGAPTDF